MKKTLSKKQAEAQVTEFFDNIKDKKPKQVKKIKRLAMAYNLPLKEGRKKFCKKCLNPYTGNEKIRIKNKTKTIRCNNCEYVARWKLK